MRIRESKRRMPAFYPAAAFAVLICLSLFLTAPGIARTKADPGTGGEALIILENSTGSRWSQLERLNVFANQKYGGRPIIAPGSSGEYVFTVKNSARFPLRYTLNISDENEAGVPMEYRLKQGGEYLAGSESEWADISTLSAVDGDLRRESEVVYTLEWHWPDGNNETDTSAGTAVPDGAEYLLNFSISAEQNGEAPGDQTNPDSSISSGHRGETSDQTNSGMASQTGDALPASPQTGDTSHTALWLALAVTSALLLLVNPMKRKETDHE